MLKELLDEVMLELKHYPDIEVEYDFSLMAHPTAPEVALWLIRNPALYAYRELDSVGALVEYLRRCQGE